MLFIGTPDKGIIRIDISDFVSVEDENINDAFLISPNPANDYITISQNSGFNKFFQNDEILIYNMFGELVLNVGKSLDPTVRVEITTLSKGMYVVNVGNRTSKFVKL